MVEERSDDTTGPRPEPALDPEGIAEDLKLSHRKVVPSGIPPGCVPVDVVTGGVVASLLNHRLLAANLPGSEFILISINRGPGFVANCATSKLALRACIRQTLPRLCW